ncbi:MAG: YqaJ viral recombinase family protein [Candidatus Kapabacteria bacterium]|nr:YqaJ viral recombinase family protein [Candidatus Kapabacteria bacterium]
MATVATEKNQIDETESAWLAKRRMGIGGTDIAAICGMDKWKSPLDVYRAKVEGVKVEDNAAMRRGRALESLVADEYAINSDNIVLLPEKRIVEHPNCTYFLASVDRIIMPKDGSQFSGNGILECKTTARLIDRETIPQTWVCQAQWYMYVMDLQWASIAWMGGNFQFDYIEIERNDEFIDYLVQEAVKFWTNHIEPQSPPEPRTAADVMYLYPKHSPGKELPLVEESARVVETYKSLTARIKHLEAEQDELKERIITMFGDAESLTYAGQTLATYKAPKDSVKFDTKRFEVENAELYNTYCITVPNSRRLLVK